MKKFIFLIILCPLTLWGQNLIQAEYFFDMDPGYGKGINMNFNPSETISLNANLYIGSVSPGYHTLYFRMKDETNGWGHTYTSKVLVGSPAAKILNAEYFFDTDPGYETGIKLNFNPKETVSLNANLYIGSVPPGYHNLYFRMKDENNGWGQTYASKVFVGSPEAKILNAEYFFDKDPGYGKGINMQFDDTNSISLSANLYIEMLVPGLHNLFYRFRSERGWGPTLSHKVYKPANSKISKLVYSFDDMSEEYVIHLDPVVYHLDFEQSIDISALEDGDHEIHIYVENVNGLKSDSFDASILTGPKAGVDDVKKSKPEFYPNPASEWLYFSDDVKSAPVSIISLEGKLIKSFVASEKLDVSDLSNGLYLMTYQIGGKYRIASLVIKH